jgi:hypothetical protein
MLEHYDLTRLRKLAETLFKPNDTN